MYEVILESRGLSGGCSGVWVGVTTGLEFIRGI